jgi:serine/threonine protein kinase
MYRDPDTGLPVLLMELMDESLTHFLETATRSIPYHIQVNICHDIALALTFLHTNGIVHRDLSSNNVLLISNVRAKVTDFGMAKLGDLNPRMSRLTFTMCPGTDVYMPPEAVQDQPVYTEKIDCFSYGVIIIQTLTRQFPKPGDRMQRVEINHPGLPRGTVMVCIPEIDRRQNHISQIDPNNTLQPIALDCLKDRDVERPSAQQLCERLAALKENHAYAESVRATQTMVTQSLRDMQELREQHAEEIHTLQEVQASQISEKEAKQQDIHDLLRSHDKAIADKERENQHLRRELQQTTLRMNEREQTIETLEQQLKQMQLDPSPIDQIRLRANSGSQKYGNVILAWRKGNPAPKAMCRVSHAVVDNTKVYFNDRSIYCYNMSNGSWTRLPDCPNEYSSFVVINSMLTAIGGVTGILYSNNVYSLKGRTWVEEFPPMPTKRCSATAVCIKSVLIVAGGYSHQCPVEVMNVESRQWSTAASSYTCRKTISICASGIICGDQLYVLGGDQSKVVYSCSLTDLLQSCQSGSQVAPRLQSNIWRKLADLPFYYSTCVSLSGHLLAIGGSRNSFYLLRDSEDAGSKAVYAYKPTTNSWKVICEMSMSRYDCFAVTLPTTNELMVVDGWSKGRSTDSVEFASLT